MFFSKHFVQIYHYSQLLLITFVPKANALIRKLSLFHKNSSVFQICFFEWYVCRLGYIQTKMADTYTNIYTGKKDNEYTSRIHNWFWLQQSSTETSIKINYDSQCFSPLTVTHNFKSHSREQFVIILPERVCHCFLKFAQQLVVTALQVLGYGYTPRA